MANFKILLRKNRVDKDGNTPIYIRVTHRSKTRYIDTGIKINPLHEFDAGQVKKHAKSRLYNIQLNNLLNKYNTKIENLGPIRTKSLNMNTLLNMLRHIDGNPAAADFFEFTRQHIKLLQESGRQSYAATFSRTIKMVQEITKTDFLTFSEITPAFLNNMAHKMTMATLSKTTIAIYMRNMRTIYNLAIADPDQTANFNDYPFRDYKIPKSAARKLNLQVADIRTLINFTPQTPAQHRARDLFLLSFYLIGINFKDLLHLTPADVFRGRIIYDRAKTKKPYSVLIQPEAAELLARYPGQKYLLSFMDAKEAANKNADRSTPLYKDITDQVNKTFRDLKKQNKLDFKLSTYYARHTWATIARNIGIPKDDIITALGHGNNTVTDAYIDIDFKRIDEANRRVIDSIKLSNV